jgi:hypothetical protein
MCWLDDDGDSMKEDLWWVKLLGLWLVGVRGDRERNNLLVVLCGSGHS